MQGLIPQAFIDELLNQIDIVDLIDAYVPLKKRGNSYVACCPFHQEKTPSFNVIHKKQFYHCFGCGASGNAISFAMNYLHQPFPEAIQTLAARAGMRLPERDVDPKKQQTVSLSQLLQRITTFYQQTLNKTPEAIAYLKQRGINRDVALRYQLGYAPSGWHTLSHQFKQEKTALIQTGMLIQSDEGNNYDRYRHRIIFPIHDKRGRVIGFGGRSIDADQKPKYLNSPETVLFQKSRELYGLYQLKQNPTAHAPIIIVEGYLDVIALAQFGLQNVVATLGTSTSTHHIQLLAKETQSLIFCFDGDEAGRQAAWRALESCLPFLNDGLEAAFIFLPNEHDPDSFVRQLGLEAFQKKLAEAKPLHQFFFDTLLTGVESKELSGKTQLLAAAKPLLLKLPDGPYKDLMFNELARLTRIEPHRIHQFLLDKSTESTESPKQTITRTPLRVAIALLLQHPQLYLNQKEKLPQSLMDQINQPVLQTLLEQVNEHPNIHTARLVESWRDNPMFDVINKLAVWDHQVPEEALEREFIDIMHFLAKQTHEQTIQTLLDKARQTPLTNTERATLQTLLKQRHLT